MGADKVENKPAKQEEKGGFNLSSIALDLLMGAAEGGVLGFGAGNIAAAAAKGAAKAAEAGLKASEPVREQMHKDADSHSTLMNAICPTWRFWEKAGNAELNIVKDHIHNNPTTAGIEMLVPPLLVIDANFRKLLGH
jgi:hypothetical protein